MKHKMTITNLNHLFNNKYIDSISLVFGRLVQRVSGREDPWVTLAAALVSRAAGQGHVCLDLARAAQEGLAASDGRDTLAIGVSAAAWCAHLENSPAVGCPGEYKPLILDHARLYLHRFWNYESELAVGLRRRCRASTGLPIDAHLREEALVRLFPDAPEQRTAARLVLTRPLSVISGGPGTGKTFTLAKIILLLTGLSTEQPLRIKLAAPTGKAAARLQESLQDTVARLAPGDPRPLALADEAQTLHRLLGIGPHSAKARHDSARPLPAEVVIVDEASMIDLSLMVKLLRAVPEQTHLVLTGDKDQLASVEAGAVLGDICRGLSKEDRAPDAARGAMPPAQDFPAPIALLHTSYRFSRQGGIGALSRAINAGDAAQVVGLLTRKDASEIGFAAVTKFSQAAVMLEAEIIGNYGPLGEMADPGKALEWLKQFKILSAVRQGPMGVENLNQWAQNLLRRKGMIAPIPGAADWHVGRPVMVTRNDYFHRLFNGDTGVAVRAMERSEGWVEVAFEPSPGIIRRLKPHELPAHETVYAMTVHKSQGSEFERVILVLPDRDVPLLTRELIYTAVTRARTSLLIVGDPQLLEIAVKRRTERASGLRDALSVVDPAD
jgi:exodeoxyribonuclease V alpha subunit